MQPLLADGPPSLAAGMALALRPLQHTTISNTHRRLHTYGGPFAARDLLPTTVPITCLKPVAARAKRPQLATRSMLLAGCPIRCVTWLN